VYSRLALRRSSRDRQPRLPPRHSPQALVRNVCGQHVDETPLLLNAMPSNPSYIVCREGGGAGIHAPENPNALAYRRRLPCVN
jgi:hypothetical protein